MSAPQFMPFYVGDYLRDTQHLTAEQHGAYLLLLMACWTLGALPDNQRALARIAKLSHAKWHRFLFNFEHFFEKKSDGLWHQKRIDRERQHLETIKAARSKAGILSAAKRQQKANSRAGLPQPQLQLQSSLRSDSDASASPVSSPLHYEETSALAHAREAQKIFWKRAKNLVGDSGAVGRQLREVGRDKVDEALNAIERTHPDEPVAFFVACCQDRTPQPSNRHAGDRAGPKEPMTPEMREQVLAMLKGDPPNEAPEIE